MNGRFAKILILFLCGTLLLVPPASAGFLDFLFGTPAPTPTQVPTGGGTGQAQGAVSPDLGNILSLLRTINQQVSLVAENTRPEVKGLVTGNIVLFDTNGNAANAITSGTAIVALPSGKCDVVIFAQTVGLYVTLEEEKDIQIGKERYYRNRQTCLNEPMCRRTVQLDDNFAFLYLEYKPYSPSNSLSRVTLSYRCQQL